MAGHLRWRSWRKQQNTLALHWKEQIMIDAEPPFPPITEFTSLERILLGSLDNANTCCDAISFIKRVPAFAVWKSQEAHCENDEPEDPAAKGNQAKPSRCDIII
jgi:hypothetical protein